MSASLAPPPETAAAPPAPCPKLGWSQAYESLPAVRNVHSLDLDVTEACNLACVYCFKWQKKPVHINEARAKNALDWLLEASGDFTGELKVNFMGGGAAAPFRPDPEDRPLRQVPRPAAWQETALWLHDQLHAPARRSGVRL